MLGGFEMNENKMNDLKINIDTSGLDELIEKLNRATQLLKELIELLDSIKIF